MRLTRQAGAKALIPTASMADIAFLLIIFFMVTTTHELDRTSVNLPSGKIRVEADKGTAIVVLAKQTIGGVTSLVYKFSDGDNMSRPVGGPSDIYLEAARAAAKDSTKPFMLKADGTVPFEKIDELLDAMRKGGVQKVLLLTQQKVEGSP